MAARWRRWHPGAPGGGGCGGARARLPRVPRAVGGAAVDGDTRARVLRARTAGDSPSASGVVRGDCPLQLADSARHRRALRPAALVGGADGRAVEQSAPRVRVRCRFHRPLRPRGIRPAIGARAPGSRPRADGRRQRGGRDAGEPIRLGALPLPLRERDRAADAQHRRARPSLPPGIPRVLRVRGRCGGALVVAAAPARAVGSARVRPLRCPRLPISPAHATRLSCHGADARVAADDSGQLVASTAGRRSRRRSRRPFFYPASR